MLVDLTRQARRNPRQSDVLPKFDSGDRLQRHPGSEAFTRTLRDHETNGSFAIGQVSREIRRLDAQDHPISWRSRVPINLGENPGKGGKTRETRCQPSGVKGVRSRGGSKGSGAESRVSQRGQEPIP
jgi:hypothetical protein